MKAYSLAIDIGASSGRHILGWLEDGCLKTEEIYRFPNNPSTVTKDGERCLKWDIDRLFEEILTGLAHKDGYCVIVVTHDMEVAEKADVVFRIKDGELTKLKK